MKFLFDENCSPSNKFLESNPRCENVKYRFKQGIKDEHILEHINNDEYIIVTKDYRFALDAISNNFKVIFHHVDRNKNYFLEPGQFDKNTIDEFNSFELK